MRVQQGQQIICDGKYRGEDEELIACGAQLPPGQHAIANTAGVLGHHCSFCHDPLQTAEVAGKLDVSEVELREQYKDLPAALRVAQAKEDGPPKKNGKPKANWP